MAIRVKDTLAKKRVRKIPDREAGLFEKQKADRSLDGRCCSLVVKGRRS